MVPSPLWGDGVNYVTWALENKSGVLIRADVLWRSIVLARPAYLPRSPLKNARATAHCVRDACLQENRLEQAQNVLYNHHIGGDGKVNRSDDE